MKLKYILILLPILLLVLAACAPDPRKQAEAFKTTTEANQWALDQEQNRAHAQEMFEIQKQQETLAYQMNAELKQRLWSVIYIALTCVSVAALVFGGRSTIQAYQVVSLGIANATVRAAQVKANLIYLDARTGQFPVFLYEGHGRYMMVMPGNAGVIPLDTRHEPDRQMIATQGVALETFLLAREAAKSEDPAGVSVISPKQIDVTPEMANFHKLVMDVDPVKKGWDDE